MRRREFIGLLGSAAVGWPLAVSAQQDAKVLRLGTVATQPRSAPFYVAFEQRMTELGYQEGRNFAFEFVHTPSIGSYEPAYREIGARKVDIILTGGPELSLKSALAATNTIPIVMVAVDYDPFARGYVMSLGRPNGLVTGVFLQQIELTVKRLQLMKDAFPDMQAATVFWDRISADQWEAAKGAGTTLRVRLAGIELRELPYDYDAALAQTAPEDRAILFVMTSPFFFLNRARLADFALRNRIVSVFRFREWAAAGGLVSYGPSLTGMFRLAADYVDRIAKGAKPADLPIQQPTKFELVVNLKTAKALGLTVPPSLLVRADEVIE